MKKLSLWQWVFGLIFGLLKRNGRRTEIKSLGYNQLTEQRKGEIAWLLVKNNLAKNGLPVGSALKKEAGSIAQALEISVGEVIRFYRTVHLELHNDAFPFRRPLLKSEYLLSQESLEKISLRYLRLRFSKEHLRLDKERLGKEIFNKAREIGVDQNELWSLFAEFSVFLLYKGLAPLTAQEQ